MPNLGWHDYLVAVSCIASMLGLWLLYDTQRSKDDQLEETDYILFAMSFTYWMVYCFASGLEKLVIPDWDVMLMSLKLTSVIAYLLTFTCVLCLPLHYIASRQKVEE